MRFAFLFFVVAGVCFARAQSAAVFDIPRVENIVIDGKPEDWGDGGYRVDLMPGDDGKLRPANEFSSAFRLGWDERGLLVLARAVDNTPADPPDGELWRGDSVELYVARQRGSADFYQVMLSPPRRLKEKRVRQQIVDLRKTESLRARPLQVTAESTTAGDAYVIEALLPWESLGIMAKSGEELAFQIYFDDGAGGARDLLRAKWYPQFGAHENSKLMHRIRLADRASPPVRVSATARYEEFRRTRVDVVAAPTFIGKAVTIRSGDKTFGPATLVDVNGYGQAMVALPLPPRGEIPAAVVASMNDEQVAEVQLPDLDEQRARAFLDARLKFEPVFSGERFPQIEFDQPALVEDLIGPYAVHTTFFNNDRQPTTRATRPGRYGAVIGINSADGRSYRRFRTLLCTTQPVRESRHFMRASLALAPELGIDPFVAKQNERAFDEPLTYGFYADLWRYPGNVGILAAMAEMRQVCYGLRFCDDANARDRQWWVDLKRQLYNSPPAPAEDVIGPSTMSGAPASVVHEGSLQAAGMKPDTARRLDALLKEWSANSDEPFATCIARHGVIVLHEAYGRRDGAEMTVDMPSRMASITKTLSGICMMMLVDKGLVSLDDPVEKFLPPFRNVSVKTPLKIHHLYTHTNGLWDHWGDDLNDFEQLIGGYYPHLQVGVRHAYNGAGIALGGKVMEIVSGAALPQFYNRHLLEPLGCDHTTALTTSYDARSVPLDMAKIGQMLLNKGAYGDQRFFSEKTFQLMMPQRLTRLLGPETTIDWGIGLTWMDESAKEHHVIGHGAASSATLQIDLANDLVIVMTRNAAGKNFGSYHAKFLQMIHDCVQ